MPVLLLWYFDSDIEWAILTEQFDIDRAIALNGEKLNCAEDAGTDAAQALEWLDGLGLKWFLRSGATDLPAMPNGLKVVTIFGYF